MCRLLSGTHIPEPPPVKTSNHSCLHVKKFSENFISQLNVIPAGCGNLFFFNSIHLLISKGNVARQGFLSSMDFFCFVLLMRVSEKLLKLDSSLHLQQRSHLDLFVHPCNKIILCFSLDIFVPTCGKDE